jgi:hypothetical protein
MEIREGEYIISTEKSLLSIETIFDLLSKSYWASNRNQETIELSIKNSLCYGLYYNNEQVGFARVVTDYATMYWLGDVIIDEAHS